MHVLKDGLVVSITPTLDTAQYASGDVLFAATKLSEVTLNTKGVSALKSVMVLDLAEQKQAIDLLLFNDVPPSVGAFNTALAITDLSSLIGQISIATSDYTTLKTSTNAIAVKSLDTLLCAKRGLRDIWVVGVCRSGTPTYLATSLTIKFMLERYS